MSKNTQIQERYYVNSYFIFWFGQIISLLGSNIVQFAVVWWITIETRSSVMLGLSAFLGFIPAVIVAPLAGVYVDRFSRKTMIAMMDMLQALVTFILIYSFTVNLGSIWFVLIVNFIRGCFQAFHSPAIEAIVPVMVPKQHLSRVNSINLFANGIIGVIGPGIAATLFIFYSFENILWIDVFSFLIAIIPLLFIVVPEPMTSKVKIKKSFKQDFAVGLEFIKQQNGLFALLSMFTLFNLLSIPVFTLLPLFITEVHNGSSADLANVIASQNLGLLIAAIIFTFWSGFKIKMNGVIIGLYSITTGIMLSLLSAPGDILLVIIGFFIVGVAMIIGRVSHQAIWQTVVPPELMGRVMSVRHAISWFAIPVSMLSSGVLAEIIDLRVLFWGLSITLILVLTFFWFFTGISKVEEKNLSSLFPETIPIFPQT